MAYADPKSFDTLEKAQAEIARLQRVIDDAANTAEAIARNFTELLPEIHVARADIAKLLGKEGA